MPEAVGKVGFYLFAASQQPVAQAQVALTPFGRCQQSRAGGQLDNLLAVEQFQIVGFKSFKKSLFRFGSLARLSVLLHKSVHYFQCAGLVPSAKECVVVEMMVSVICQPIDTCIARTMDAQVGWLYRQTEH